MTKQHIDIIEAEMQNYVGRDFANRTLARQIIAKYPTLFDDTMLESVRGAIRYRRGSNGDYLRSFAREAFIRNVDKPSAYIKQYLKAPVKPRVRDWRLPDTHRKVLILSDLHIPYHNSEAILTAIDYAIESNVDGIYLNGDVIDFAKISRWMKDPELPSPQVEIDMVNEFLLGLTGFGLPIYYKMGNHEDRWNAYLIQNAPDMYGLDALDISNILGLDNLGIELIDSKTKAHFGKLLVIHGHEFGESVFSPVNPARGLFNKAKTSVIAGHNHQTSTHHENDLNGNPTGTFSLGCLCDLSPDYRPYAYTKWNHGFAIVDIESDGNYTVHNKRIEQGRVR